MLFMSPSLIQYNFHTLFNNDNIIFPCTKIITEASLKKFPLIARTLCPTNHFSACFFRYVPHPYFSHMSLNFHVIQL